MTYSARNPCYPTATLMRLLDWRRVAESNRPSRICNPEHNLFANPPSAFYYIQSGNRQWNQIRLRPTKASSLSEQELPCARPTSTSPALWFQCARSSVVRVTQPVTGFIQQRLTADHYRELLDAAIRCRQPIQVIFYEFGTIYRVNFRGLCTRFGTTPITRPIKFISVKKFDKKVG